MLNNTVIEKINHVRLPPVVGKDTAKSLEDSISDWMELPVQVHVFDFGGVLKMHNSLYGPLAKFKREVEKYKKAKVISVNIKPDLFQKLQSDGMDSAIGYLKNLANIEGSKSRDPVSEMKRWVMRYLGESAREAMSTMFKVDLKSAELAAGPAGLENLYRAAVLNAEGQGLKMRLRVFFEQPCIEGLAQKFGGGGGPDAQLVESTASELLNLIYGAGKSKLNDDRGYQLGPAIPQLMSVSAAASEPRAIGSDSKWMSFTVPTGSFFLEVEFST